MNKKVLISFISIILIGGMLITGSALITQDETVANAAQSTGTRENVIVVYGEGKVNIKPDIAYINVGVETLDKDAKKAQDINKTTMTKVIDKLKSMGIDEKDIKTIRYSVDQEIDYVDGKRNVLGYRVYNTIRITVKKIDKVGEVVNVAYNEGANNIYGISFDIADRKTVYKQALQKAIDDAKDKADVMAKQAGVKIGKPIAIYEGYQGDVFYGARNSGFKEDMAMDMGAESYVPVEVGELEIEANVTVEYKY